MRRGQQRARVPRDGVRVVIDDPPIDRPVQACSHCGEHFQPTQRRRMLCHDCFTYSESDPPTYSLRLTTRPR